MTYRKKLIEVSLPLEAINAASAREKSIRHGHPSTLHLWWARRPLAAARAVIFSQIVDDPSSDPGFDAYKGEDREQAVATARAALHDLIRELVLWESTTNEKVLDRARAEIARSIAQDKLDSGEMEKDTAFYDAPPTSPRGFGDEKKTVLWDLRRRAAKPEAVRHFLAEHAPGFHDPFAGGGALPLEAQRLGLKAYASDLNPVAVLINKAMIEIPPKFAGMPPINPDARKDKKIFAKDWHGAKGLAEDVRYYGQWMRDEAERRIGQMYPEIEVTAEMAKGRPELKQYVGRKLTVIAWLWTRTVKSPNPAVARVSVPLASTFMLRTKKGQEVFVHPVVSTSPPGYHFEVRQQNPEDEQSVRAGTTAGKRAAFRCLLTGVPITYPYIRSEGKAGRLDARLMAIVASGDRERVYLSPDSTHEKKALSASPDWRPEVELPANPRDFKTPNYGIETFSELFTDRQLLALSTFAQLVEEVRSQILSDAEKAALGAERVPNEKLKAQAYADAIAVYLAFGVDKMADRHSTLGRWDPTPTASGIQNTFSKQAIPMTWDYAEANPFSEASGNFEGGVNWIAKVIETSLPAYNEGVARQEDASSQSTSNGKYVSLDPPYYDNIGYADLSDYFYIWERKALAHVLPELFATLVVPKAEELVATPYRHGGKDQAEAFFLDGMTRSIGRLAELAYANAPVTVFYAFKQSETKGSEGTASTGWETFIDAVVASGFGITGTWPIRTEMATRQIARGANALASSIVLVCRRRPADAQSTTRGAFVRALQNEMPEALRELQATNIAPVDLPQSCIGPGMAIFTRYKSVLNQDDTPMTVREALQLINEAIDSFFSEQEADYDSETRFAVTWFDQHGFNDGPFGEADNLAKARNVAVQGVVEAGILKSGQGKVRLLRRSELLKDWDPATDNRPVAWESLQYLVRELEEHGEAGAAELAAKLTPHQRTLARELAYRLYTTCERKKDATEARAYNALITSWPEIERLAEKPASGTKPKGNMFT